MASITSANVACGFHAGDPSVMRRTVALAGTHGVAVGAHPGLPRSGRVRATRDPGDAARGRRPRPLSGGGTGRHRRRSRRPAAARESARRALQPGVPRRAGWPTRSRAPWPRSIDRSSCSVCPARSCSAPASAPGLTRRRRGLRRPRLRTRWLAGVAAQAGQRHSRRRRGRRARGADGPRPRSRRHRRVGDPPRGRHDLSPRRYTGCGRAGQTRARGPRSGGRSISPR